MDTTKIHSYKVIIEQGHDGYFIARVPALPGCFTQAKTYEELIFRVKEAIQLCKEVITDDAHYRERCDALAFEPSFIGLTEVAV